MFLLCSRRYDRRMDLSRDQLTSMIVTALMADSDFRSTRGRRWHETAEDDRTRAHIVAGHVVDHLERCGVTWSKRPPRATTFRTP